MKSLKDLNKKKKMIGTSRKIWAPDFHRRKVSGSNPNDGSRLTNTAVCIKRTFWRPVVHILTKRLPEAIDLTHVYAPHLNNSNNNGHDGVCQWLNISQRPASLPSRFLRVALITASMQGQPYPWETKKFVEE